MKDFKSFSPSDYLRILWRRRWYALAAFLIVSIGASVYAWRMPNVYRSTSRVKVESPAIPQDYVRPSIRSTPEDQIAAVRSAVQSRSFLQRMIQDFQLFGYGTGPEFSMEDTIKAVSKSIQITNTSPDAFNIGFSASDPQLAQSLTKRMVETLIQSNTSSRKTTAIETDRFLDEQLRQTQKNLDAQDEELRQFRTAHLGELPEQSQAVMNALSRLDVQLASTENALDNLQERKKLLGIMAQNQNRMTLLTQDLILPEQNSPSVTIANDAPNALLMAKQAELAALTAKYTPQYPDVVRLTREVENLKQKLAREKEEAEKSAPVMPLDEQNIQPQAKKSEPDLDALPTAGDFELESINNDIKKKEKERDAILGQMKKFQGKLNLAPALEQELTALSRERETLNQQYTSLQGKKFQSQMTTTLESNENGATYRVVDEANLPEKPIPPTRLQIILIGIGAGLALGLGAAFGREMLDTTLGSEDEVSAVLKLPTLATVSEISRKEPKQLAGLAKSA